MHQKFKRLPSLQTIQDLVKKVTLIGFIANKVAADTFTITPRITEGVKKILKFCMLHTSIRATLNLKIEQFHFMPHVYMTKFCIQNIYFPNSHRIPIYIMWFLIMRKS